MNLEELIQTVNPDEGKKKETMDRQNFVKSLWKQLENTALRPTELVKKMAIVIFKEDDFDEVENEDENVEGCEDLQIVINENENVDESEDKEMGYSEGENENVEESEDEAMAYSEDEGSEDEANEDSSDEFVVNDYSEGSTINTLILFSILILFNSKKLF